MRSYLAVKDGFQTEVYFNSRSVTVREGIGKSISKGDIVRCSDLSQIQQQTRSVPEQFIPDYTSTLTLHLLPSYQFQRFSKQQKHTFFNQVYEIDHGSDRTGCRLSGEPIVEVPHALISEGIAYGSVEITSAGQPIILLNDRPTIGGYPKIGTVFSLDLFALAQRQAGDMVMFELIDIDTVQTRRREFNGFFNL
jgi:allophanate hydrolase subunit 2